MKYDNLSAFEKYLKETESKKLRSFYLIIGKDPWETQEAIDLLLQTLLPSPAAREFGLTVFDGEQVDPMGLDNALDSDSFFSKTQVVYIQKFDKSKKAVQENIERGLISPRRGLTIVLNATSWSKNSNFYKGAEKEGIILDLIDLKPWEKEKHLIAWVGKRVTAARKLISYPACQLLVKRAGCDQSLLHQEIEKLFCYCLDRNEIGVKDIEAICSHEHVDTIWQLGEAIFQRDTASALQISQGLLTGGLPLLPLLRQIRSQFQTEYQVSLLLAQGRQSDIAGQFAYMKGKILDRHIEQAQQYGSSALKAGLLVIDETEAKAKNSVASDLILLELLIFSLTKRK